MLMEHQHPDNKSIQACLIGIPNAGKSTLTNAMLGFDLSIVSHKPQTTRNRFHCVFNIDRTEVIIQDTPGIHQSVQELNLRMNDQATSSLEGSDLALILLDTSEKPINQLNFLLNKLERQMTLLQNMHVAVVLTKKDISNFHAQDIEVLESEIKDILDSFHVKLHKCFYISAPKEEGMNELYDTFLELAQEGPHLYPSGDVSNKNQRFFASEYIREQTFELLKSELPYEVAVVIDDFQDPFEKNGKMLAARISATILVNRPSQRAIVVGQKGGMIKQIGMRSRKKIEEMIGEKVLLNLHVKVTPRWFKNNYVLDELGLPRTHQSRRVWRSES